MKNTAINLRVASAQQILEICASQNVTPREALRDGNFTVLIPDLRLIWEINPETKTKEGMMAYPIIGGKSQVIFRLLSDETGKLHLRNKTRELDAYAWTAQDILSRAKKILPFGINSEEGKQTLETLLSYMSDEEEKEEILKTLYLFRIDFQAVMVKPDWRKVVEVTQELYDAGVTSVINSWEDESSGFRATELQVGDFLVIESPEKAYCIRREEFIETHSTYKF